MSLHRQDTLPFFEATDLDLRSGKVEDDEATVAAHATDMREPIADRPLTIPEKLVSVRENEGFYPVSKLELSSAQELIGAEEEFGPFAVVRHLQEVKWRQQKPHIKAEDPAAAVRSIVRTYGDFYGRARYDATMLQQLAAQLEELLRIDPKQPFSDFIEQSGIPLREGPAQFIRYFDLRLIAEQGDIHAAGFDSLAVAAEVSTDPYTNKPTKEGLARIADRTGTITTLRARDCLGEVVDAEQFRMKYWKTVLRRADTYYLARPVVRNIVNIQDDSA